MPAAFSHAGDLLRGTGRFDPETMLSRPWWWLPVMALCFGPVYGAAMGSYHLVEIQRVWQMVFAGVKVPLLLFATSLVCLPAFFVINTVLGLRDDFRESLQAILAGQATLSIALAALSPVTRFWYFSALDYNNAILFNAGMFALATLAGHLVMLRSYRPLIRRHRFHRISLYGWVLMYAFVGIQMGWTLRPFIGSPDTVVSFFREEKFTNAYVVMMRLVFGLFIACWRRLGPLIKTKMVVSGCGREHPPGSLACIGG